MRVYKLLPLAAVLASAIVIPDEYDMNQVAFEGHDDGSLFSRLKDSLTGTVESAKSAIDEAIEDTSDAIHDAVEDVFDYAEDKYFDAEGWVKDFKTAHEDEFDYSVQEDLDDETVRKHWDNLEEATHSWREGMGFGERHSDERPCPHGEHRGPPVRGGPNKYRRPSPPGVLPPDHPSPPEADDEDDQHHGRPPHHRPPHHRRPHHPHKSNLTIYQLISKSKYTTKLAKLVNEFPEVVEILNNTNNDFTMFVPTDKAFEKLPHFGKKPSKEFLLKVLAYHVVKFPAPAGVVLKSRTLPTSLGGEGLSEEPEKTPQRLSVNLGLKGLSVNFYSRVVAIDIFATNGIIHAVDSLLFPPPKGMSIIQFLPAQFSTLELALFKTHLFPVLNDTSNHLGGVLFAPTNGAFQKLGPKLTGFLFSPYGRKYLKALISYHVVANTTLYSDVIYVAHKDSTEEGGDVDAERTFHVDLPTLLKGKSLSIDVAKWARFVDIRINGFYHVAVTDGIAYDGVIHVLSHVLIPPKSPGAAASWADEQISVQELVERLEPYVEQDEADDGAWKMDADSSRHGQHVPDMPLEL